MTKRPKAWNDAFTVGEDATAILAVLANDRTPPDDPLRIVKLTGHDLHGAVTVATDGQSLLWHDDDAFDFLAEGQTQLLRFKYVALTEDGDRVRATVRLTVAGADDAPSAGADQTVTVADNIADTVPIATVVGSDVDQGAVLAYSLTGGNDAGLFEIDRATGVISLAAGKALDFATARHHVLTVAVGDGSLSDTAQVTVQVRNVSTAGPLDLLTANQQSNDVSVRLGNGTGGFTSAPTVSAGSGPSGVAVGDLNSDGIFDLVVSNENSNTVSVRLGNGPGGFIVAPDVSVGDVPFSVALGDLNKDGKLDLVTANLPDRDVSVFLGNGMGGFTSAPAVPVSSWASSVALGDVNNDTRLDLVVANAGTVSVRLGNGAGSFTSAPDVPISAGPFSVALGDVNNDGKLDFVTANEPSASNNVSVRLGDGMGGFTSPATPEVPVGSGPVAVALGDVNNDGKLDFVTADQFSNDVSVRLGNGAGGFTSAPSVPVGTTPVSVALGDIDGDGKLDLVTANQGSNDVSVRLGNGAGGFSGTTTVAVGTFPASVVVVDIDSTATLTPAGLPDLGPLVPMPADLLI